MSNKYQNRLILEKSPYLLQHSSNPVNWYPWGDEAFAKAREENKPIFLSIGYSTCHWCHVMEHESFANSEIGSLMNDTFISIKVDREERPDIDAVYMQVCQIMTGSGGWPLTIIMTPHKEPFFTATYIPKEAKFGQVGMLDLIPRIKELWVTRHADILNSASQIISALQQTSMTMPGKELGEPILHLAYEQLAGRFDEQYGGFGSAPKFVTPHNLLFLLRYWARTGNQKALYMVEKTLQEIRLGGIYDHIGYGFHRYSTDSQWLVPHFEKMLYDQAMLAMAYTETYQATGKVEYSQTAHEIFAYVLRDMAAPEGIFYSAEDADSEGTEGKFYVWGRGEINHILSAEEADLAFKVFHIQEEGNFIEFNGGKTGNNILHLTAPFEEIASDMKMSLPELRRNMEVIRQKLCAYRENRIHPYKDDKILTDWNGLMIAALAKGARVFGDFGYISAAEKATQFIQNNMITPDGRLLHRYRDGQSSISAYLDDYAFLIYAMLELYETTFTESYLKWALSLNQDLIEHFWDKDNGGFYFTADDSENLLIRQKEIYDGAIPSGNSVAMLNLLRLGRMTANPDLDDKAARIGRAFANNVRQSPSSYTQLMAALDFALGPTYEIVLAGDSKTEDMKEMLEAIQTRYIPNKVVILRQMDQESSEINHIAPFTTDLVSIDGKATAYLCLNYACQLPTTDTNTMLGFFNSN
jgi:uncharacterized protein YyaL (SSP411 family)